jgi:hypothetical protein
MRRILRTRHRMKCDEGEESGARSQDPGVLVSPPFLTPTCSRPDLGSKRLAHDFSSAEDNKLISLATAQIRRHSKSEYEYE